MKEYVEFRLEKEYAQHLFKEDEGVDIPDSSLKIVKVETSDPRFEAIGKLELRRSKGLVFTSYEYKRVYTDEEMRKARFFKMDPFPFTMAGEECGTKYDESTACPLCRSGAKMITPLKIRANRIPKKDFSIAMGWGEEVIVSSRFKQLVEENGLTGMRFAPVYSGKRETGYYQLIPIHYFDVSPKTKFGSNPFKDAEYEMDPIYAKNSYGKVIGYEKIYYRCPNGDNLGLNILSEAYVKASPLMDGLDFFASRQTYGARMGYFRPNHLMFCSNRMMRIIKENKLKGFDFEVAHIVEEDTIGDSDSDSKGSLKAALTSLVKTCSSKLKREE